MQIDADSRTLEKIDAMQSLSPDLRLFRLLEPCQCQSKSEGKKKNQYPLVMSQ